MNLKDGELQQITINHLIGNYKINKGDLSTMTNLQLIAVTTICNTICEFKMDNKPFAVI